MGTSKVEKSLEPSISAQEARFSCSNSTIVKISLVVFGLLLIGAALAAHFYQVNAIATYTMGIAGGILILATAIASIYVYFNAKKSQLEELEDGKKQLEDGKNQLKELEDQLQKEKNLAEQSKWIEYARNGEMLKIQEALKNNISLPKEQLLQVAASQGHSELVAELLASGANPRHTDNRGYSTLHLAVKCYDHQKGLNTMRILLEKDSSLVSEKTSDQELTPLHLAASLSSAQNQNIHRQKVELLIEQGAEVNAKDSDQNTPLHDAIGSGLRLADPSIEVIEALVHGGAKLDATNKAGHTPLTAAQKYCTAWYNCEAIQKRLSDLTK